MNTLVAIVAVVMSLVVLPGCATLTPEQRAEAIRINAEDRASLEASIASAEARLAAAATDEERMAAKIELGTLTWLREVNEREKAVLERPDTSVIGEIIGAVGGLLPPPYNGIAGAGALVWAILERRRALRRGSVAEAVVNAIDVAKATDPALAEAISRNGPIIRAELAKVKGAFEFVEEART